MRTRTTPIDLDFGQQRIEALDYKQHNPDVPLRQFLRVYPARAREQLPHNWLDQPLKFFTITPISVGRRGVDAIPPEADPGPARPSQVSNLRSQLDSFFEEDVRRDREQTEYPDELADDEAVRIAYRHELEDIVNFLRNDLSVLVVCDKMLTEYVYEYVCGLAGREPVLDTEAPRGQQAQRGMGGQQGGLEAILQDKIQRVGVDNPQVLVLRSLDLLDTPPLIEILYQNNRNGRKPQMLGFLDSSRDVAKVLTDRFAIRIGLMGLPRHIQPDPNRPPMNTVNLLITRHERGRFAEFDAEGLYKNVSGLNAIQFRNSMRYVGATVKTGADPRDIYERIRRFKTSTSDDIQIPDTQFEHIGGYDAVKQELMQIVHLMQGKGRGLDDRQRQELIPRGIIFHGPPGTGKTLFAKAIANEMAATIQMVSGPEIMDKYVGESESNLRRIFATARRNAPSVIFFDEFDSIASQRGSGSDGGGRANNAVVAQLLTELDGFREDQSVLVIGTTNRLDIIDEALLRPSRFRPIQIHLPDYAARRAVAEIHAKGFGVNQLLFRLYQLALRYMPPEGNIKSIPQPFLEELFAEKEIYKERWEADEQHASFLRDLINFFRLVQELHRQHGQPAAEEQAAEDDEPVETDPLTQLEEHLIDIARGYGLDLEAATGLLTPGEQIDEDEHPSWMLTMQNHIRDIYSLIDRPEAADERLSPDAFVSDIMDLVAEYTDGFNSDEIRAIFQEASLDHHMKGQLVTPRLLGLKIGLIRKRRDERKVVHLDSNVRV